MHSKEDARFPKVSYDLIASYRDEGIKMPEALNDIEAIMFAYRELHLPGKLQTFTALHRLYKEIKHDNLWLEKKEQIERKDQILNSLALIVISNAMMFIEDFIRICYAASGPLTEILERITSYGHFPRWIKNFKKKLDLGDKQVFYNILQYVSKRDLDSADFAFLKNEDKQIIVKQHEQNIKALEHVLHFAIRSYEVLKDAYNKYKHGYLYLFRMPFGISEGPKFVKELAPAIPYFADKTKPTNVTPVFVGEIILDKLIMLCNTLFQMSWDITSNVTVRCKYGGKKIIARNYYGTAPLKTDEFKRYQELIEDFDSKFLVSPGPKKLNLKIASEIKKKDWQWFFESWKFASASTCN